MSRERKEASKQERNKEEVGRNGTLYALHFCNTFRDGRKKGVMKTGKAIL